MNNEHNRFSAYVRNNLSPPARVRTQKTQCLMSQQLALCSSFSPVTIASSLRRWRLTCTDPPGWWTQQQQQQRPARTTNNVLSTLADLWRRRPGFGWLLPAKLWSLVARNKSRVCSRGYRIISWTDCWSRLTQEISFISCESYLLEPLVITC